MTLRERFYAKVAVRGDDDCWEWTGARDEKGYGRFGLDHRNDHAHRVALALEIGPLPEGCYACHTCDNKSCVNPRHLYAGSAASNRRDAIDRGLARFNPARGTASHLAKLDETAVREIRARSSRGISQRLLAITFGVSQGTISRAISGRSWSHV